MMVWWLLGMLIGCGGADRVEACNQLIGIVNPTIESLAASAGYDSSQYDEGITHLNEMSATATDAAARTRALRDGLRDETLRSHAARYADLCDQIAAATQEMSGAMAEARSLALRASQIEAALQEKVDAIVEACKPTSRIAACHPLLEQLATLPDTFSDTETIQAHREKLAGVRGDEPAVQQAVDRFSELLEKTANIHSEITKLQNTADSAHEAMEAASEEQRQIVDGINADCQG